MSNTKKNRLGRIFGGIKGKESITDVRSLTYSLGNEEPQYSTGAGLGLFLSVQLAKFFDGDIDVDSEPGIGTTVRIILKFQLGLRRAKSWMSQEILSIDR